ncbi:MAG: hypothetical protein IPF49_05920 [Gammaproteobacteria bacterium]|nr:hypothetical protein [Gammaproteobacteria bacterium]
MRTSRATPTTQGNPATRTNALGHVTQWTDYNASGQPTRMVDPNGVIRGSSPTGRAAGSRPSR